MSYSDLIEQEGINAQYLAVLKPARRQTSWALFLGSVYSAVFDYSYVSKVTINGVDLALGSSTSLSVGQYFWDFENETIYIRKSDSTAPSGSDHVIIEYELYVSTFDAHFNRVPTDDTTDVVYFDPLIAAPVPLIAGTMKDYLFGTIPTQSTSINLINSEHNLERHIYDGSFFGREIRVYHWLGDLLTANIKLVFRGKMSDVNFSGDSVSIRINSPIDFLDREFRSNNEAFFSSTDYAALDPQYEGKPIRTVYGYINGHQGVNTDYVSDNPTTSDNRDWKICQNGSLIPTVSKTVPASPSSTTTRTYVNSVSGLIVGNSVRINKATDEYRTITVVGANYIEHAALVSGAASTGDTVERGAIGRVEIFQEGKKFYPQYIRDWTETTDGNGVLTVSFSSSLESNLSMPSTLKSTDKVVFSVFGKSNNVLKNAVPFGTSDTETGNLTSLAVILFEVIRDYGQLDEDDINLTSFDDLLIDSPDAIGFAIPEKSEDNYPKLRDVVSKILQTGLIRLFQDTDLKWKVKRIAPTVSNDYEIEDDEILIDTINYSFSQQDLYSDIVVSFSHREVSDKGSGEGFSLERAESLNAKYLHNINRTYNHESLHFKRAEAETLATRLAAILGERDGQLIISTKNRFFGAEIDARIGVSRLALPGFVYDGETLNSRTFSVVAHNKSLRQVQLTMNDLKGVEDNDGEF